MPNVRIDRAPDRTPAFAQQDARWAALALLVGAAYYGTGIAALALRLEPGGISTIWLPHGVFLAALILTPARRWPLYLAVLLPVHVHLVRHFQGAVPLGIMLMQFAGNAGQAAVGAVAVRHFIGPRPRLDDLRNMTLFLVLGLTVPVLLVSAVVTGVFVIGGWVDSFGLAWHRRTLAQVCGGSMLSVIIFEIAVGRTAAVLGSRRRQLEYLALTLGVLTLVLPPVFGAHDLADQQGLFFAPLPLLLWTAVRFGPAGLSLHLLFVAIAALGLTEAGHGPFVAVSPAQSIVSLELFLLSVAIPLLLLAALVAERDRSSQSLRASEERLRLALAAGHMGAWDWDVRRQSATWSREYFSIIGLAPFSVEPSQRIWASRVHPDDLLRAERLMEEAIAERKEYRCEYRVIGADGVPRWVEAQAQPIYDLVGECVRVMGLIVDITERKRAEEALRKVQAELAHVTRVVTLGELTGSIAHEINQPLGAVVNNASACLRWLTAKNLEEARQSAVQVIADAHRAGEIIGRIRTLVKKVPPRMDWLDIDETVREVIVLARSEVQANRVSLETQLAGGLPPIWGDRIQLQQVMLNLLINAIEAMSRVNEGPRELWVSTEKGNSADVVITVRDSGPGVDPQSRDRLFDAFYTTKAEGLGMGLAISRSIVESHGGRLWATANVPHGAVFQFTVPMGRAGAA